MQPTHECRITRGVEYVVHDGVKLTGDLYQPVGGENMPVVIAVHGGGWQASTASRYKYWGPWLAKRGIARPSAEQQFRLAMHDGDLAVADELIRQGYKTPSISQLVKP